VTTRRRTQRGIASGHVRALAARGVTFDKSGRPRKGGKRLSIEDLEKEIRASKRSRPAARGPKPAPKPAPRTRGKRAAAAKKPKTKAGPPKIPAARKRAGEPKARPAPAPTYAFSDELAKTEKKLKPAERAALAKLPPDMREAALRSRTEKDRTKKAEKIRAKLSEKQAAAEEKEKQATTTALSQLKKAVRAAAKDGGKLYGEYNEKTHKRQKVKGSFAGFKRIPFEKRADYVQEDFRRKYPKEWRRDLLVQSVHVREYLVQGDGGAGRRAIIEKTQVAGRRCIDEKCVGRDGRPLRIFQIYIGMIRVLIRREDAGKYGGYATRPIDGKKIKAATDIRGLEGFEKVMPGEDPKAALDRILERLDNHLDDILDGLPVVYVKSLQIKFDVEARE
jgi:hypothetical protein